MDGHQIRLTYPWEYELQGDKQQNDRDFLDQGQGKIKSAAGLAELTEHLKSIESNFVFKLVRKFNQPTNLQNSQVFVTLVESPSIEPKVFLGTTEFPVSEFSNQQGLALIDVSEFLQVSNQLSVVLQKSDLQNEYADQFLLDVLEKTRLLIT